jgi:hypothetical protein
MGKHFFTAMQHQNQTFAFFSLPFAVVMLVSPGATEDKACKMLLTSFWRTGKMLEKFLTFTFWLLASGLRI